MRVVIVEDNAIYKEELINCLNQEAEAVDIVGITDNGAEGLAVIEKVRPDVVFTDIRMPEMDGLEATRRIRAMKRPDARTIPIIAMTANAFAEDRQLAFAAGMDMHIAKPLEGSEMVETLDRFVKSSRK